MKSLLSRFFPRLGVCKRDDWREAAVEVLIICISAFLPLWAGLGILWLSRIAGAAAAYGETFMASGEMLLIACAIIGPLIYMISKRYGTAPDPMTIRFPYTMTFQILIVLIWFISGGVFVSKKALTMTGADFFDDRAMRDLSAVIAGTSVSILYLATVLRNYMEKLDPAREMHDQQEQFVKDFDNA